MIVFYLLLIFIAIILGLSIIYYCYFKKIKNKLINILKLNSEDYLKEVISMANKKKFKLEDMINLLNSKFIDLLENYKVMNDTNLEFLKIFNLIEYGILVLNKNGVICYFNSELRELFNINECEELYNKNVCDTSLKWILDFKDLENFEVSNYIECCSYRLSKDLKLYKFKDMFEFKKSDYMSEEFISNITHELKTPLTSIIGFAETLKTVEEDEDRQIFYDIINKEAKRLNNLITDVLMFSEIETNNDINQQKIDIIELLYNIKFLLEPQISKLNFSINIFGDRIFILNSEKYLRQVFINIIDNSLKHSFGSFINIECGEDNKKVYVNFIDNGVGIPESEIEHIFKRFYKVLNSKSKGKGTGLGLSIVESCVRKVNAQIFVFNNEFGGVTFKLIIPKTQNSL